jgi:hypothetical protein
MAISRRNRRCTIQLIRQVACSCQLLRCLPSRHPLAHRHQIPRSLFHWISLVMASWMRRFSWIIATCAVFTLTPCACATPALFAFSPKALSAHVASFPFRLFINAPYVIFPIFPSSSAPASLSSHAIPVIYAISPLFTCVIFPPAICAIFLHAIFAHVITSPCVLFTLDHDATSIRALFSPCLSFPSSIFPVFACVPFIISTCVISPPYPFFPSTHAISVIFPHATFSPSPLFVFTLAPCEASLPFRE